jgi:glycosyltransferase XagB
MSSRLNGCYGQFMWGLGLFNLATGYVTAVGLGAIAVSRRSWPNLIRHALWMPVYWLMISFAAYRAMFQFFAAPYYWEKTEHSARSVEAAPVVNSG